MTPLRADALGPGRYRTDGAAAMPAELDAYVARLTRFLDDGR
ncbi:hypothetical protein [Actinomadura sp. KC345]|nr:hypothetical protein [Actinomadura sp. KC345]